MAQATLAFNALRNATSNFTISCGSSRCGTFTFAMCSSLCDSAGSGRRLCILAGTSRTLPARKENSPVTRSRQMLRDSFLRDINML